MSSTSNTTRSMQDLLKVELDSFEGPLDLLLFLCRSQEIDVRELPISSITSQYLEALGMMEQLDVDVGAEFVVMAATLCYIKSRSLLPDDGGSDDDLIEDLPSREELIRQLLEYQKYRDVVGRLVDRSVLDRNVFARERQAVQEDAADREVEGNLYLLAEALRTVLEQRKPQLSDYEVAAEEISVGERIQSTWKRMLRAARTSFYTLFERDSSRLEILVTFLAVLELVRLGAMGLMQRDDSGDLILERKWAADHPLPDASTLGLGGDDDKPGLAVQLEAPLTQTPSGPLQQQEENE